MMNTKEYLKTTLAVLSLLYVIKILHRLVMKYVENQYKLLDKIDEWDI